MTGAMREEIVTTTNMNLFDEIKDSCDRHNDRSNDGDKFNQAREEAGPQSTSLSMCPMTTTFFDLTRAHSKSLKTTHTCTDRTRNPERGAVRPFFVRIERKSDRLLSKADICKAIIVRRQIMLWIHFLPQPSPTNQSVGKFDLPHWSRRAASSNHMLVSVMLQESGI